MTMIAKLQEFAQFSTHNFHKNDNLIMPTIFELEQLSLVFCTLLIFTTYNKSTKSFCLFHIIL